MMYANSKIAHIYIYILCLKEWQDNNLRWNKTHYGGVDRLYVPSDEIWLPDLVLYNK